MKISFVIPSFNCVTWLPHAVTSCLEQKYGSVEVVIVDDGSNDMTRQYLKYLDGLKDDRIKIVRNERNMGRSYSRNYGNQVATGDVLCVLDADDIAEPKRALWVAEKFQSGAVQFLHGSARFIEASGIFVREYRAEVFNKERALADMMNRIVHSTVAYTKQVAEKCPYLDGEISELGIDDWAQQIHVVMCGIPIETIPQVLSCHRMLLSSITNIRDNGKVHKAKMEYLSKFETPVAA